MIEVMVALVIGTVIIGGVMGLISVSLNFTQRVNEKSRYVPILEAAAEQILAFPAEVTPGTLTMSDFPDSPPVNVDLVPVNGKNGDGLGSGHGQLYRVELSCKGHVLEFSVIIPQEQK